MRSKLCVRRCWREAMGSAEMLWRGFGGICEGPMIEIFVSSEDK